MFPLRCGEEPQPWRRSAAAVAVLALALAFGGGTESKHAEASAAAVPGPTGGRDRLPAQRRPPDQPRGRRQGDVHNFQLAPRQFGGEPQLGEGNLRFSLNRVPDCVDPVKLLHAINSPIGNGRLVGASFDYPAILGPNGVLAERIGTAGSYSPGPGRRSSTTACRPASTG